jgi:hypothetical protein
VLVGIGVAVTQQLTGINTIMYYGPRVLEQPGFTESEALTAATLFGLAAVVGGIIPLRNMDRIDRRNTFFIGLFATTMCHNLFGISGSTQSAGHILDRRTVTGSSSRPNGVRAALHAPPREPVPRQIQQPS